MFVSSGLDAQDLRFTAVLEDGRRVRGDEVRPWHKTSSKPTLNGVQLFEENNPLSWLRDETLPVPREPRAFVEIVGGDVLPGQVVAFSSGDAVLDDPSLPYVLVEPEVSVEPHDAAPRSGLRILTRWLRRVVWTPHLRARYQPSTLFYRDGSSIAFRSVRFGEGEVRVLLPEGIRRVPFKLIAELHFSRVDPWDAYFEQLAILSPDAESRVVRVETIDGLRLTSSMQRFRVSSHGSREKPENWLHVFQPAWSLDPVWIPHRSIRTRLYHHPAEVPLSRFAPLRVVRRPILGGSWRWRRDRNVQGGSLASGGEGYASGFGVHAHAELEFPLHAAVRSLSTRVGLDHAMAKGGCVEASVALRARLPKGEAASEGETAAARDDDSLWSSGVLVGSARAAETGKLEIPNDAAKTGRRLVLIADAVVDGRPAGADPIDVRDSVDWLEPVLDLDQKVLREEIFSRFSRVIPSLIGWTIEPEVPDKPLLVARWDETNQLERAFRSQLALGTSRVELGRRATIDGRRGWFFAAASRLPKRQRVGGARLELLVDGASVAKFDVPRRLKGEASPQALSTPLSARVRGPSEIRVIVRGEHEESEVDLRALRIHGSAPGVAELLEDGLGQSIADSRVDGAWLRDWRDPYRGAASVQVLANERVRISFEDVSFPIRAQPGYGEYRYLRFAWKKAGGGRVAIGLGHGGEWGAEPGRSRQSFRFDQGRGALTSDGARRLSRETAERWFVHTTDLVQAFGEFSLTGLELVCPDGVAAHFDHVWLSRTAKDWEGVRVDPFVDEEVWKSAMSRESSDLELAVESTELPTHGGRPGVLRTVPRSEDPADEGRVVWRRRVHIEEATSAHLALSVGHDVRGAWGLEVRVDDQVVLESLVDPSTTAAGWLDLRVPLSRFAGREVDITAVQRTRDKAYAFAYWWLFHLEGVR